MSERTVFQATVYVDSEDVQEIADHLAKTLAASADGGTIVTPILDIDVEKNHESPVGPVHNEDAFLDFPCLIEVFTADAGADERVVGALADVLAALDQLGPAYVTAADFEEELPNSGKSGT